MAENNGTSSHWFSWNEHFRPFSVSVWFLVLIAFYNCKTMEIRLLVLFSIENKLPPLQQCQINVILSISKPASAIHCIRNKIGFGFGNNGNNTFSPVALIPFETKRRHTVMHFRSLAYFFEHKIPVIMYIQMIFGLTHFPKTISETKNTFTN